MNVNMHLVGMQAVDMLFDTLVDQFAPGADWFIGTEVSYAPHVEYGTAPHEIRPRTKRALFWPGASHPVRSVQHPGTRPKPYMRPAYDTVVNQRFDDLKGRAVETSRPFGNLLRLTALELEREMKQKLRQNGSVVTGNLRGSIEAEELSGFGGLF